MSRTVLQLCPKKSKTYYMLKYRLESSATNWTHLILRVGAAPAENSNMNYATFSGSNVDCIVSTYSHCGKLYVNVWPP